MASGGGRLIWFAGGRGQGEGYARAMEDPPGAEGERRCPNCGALVLVDAEWCGQCFTPLRGSETASAGSEPTVSEHRTEADDRAPRSPDRASAPARDPATGRRAPAWPCPTCGNENPIDLDSCTVCGTSFAALMRADERPAHVEPMRAFRRSLLFPGLGHALVGRSFDGVARGVLFAMLVVMALIVVLSGPTSGVLVTVLVLFVGTAFVLYLGSAWEAYRLAAGEPAFVSSRALLWATVVVIMVSVALLALAVASATRR